MYNVHKSFSVFQTRWFLFLPLSVTDALYEPGYTKLSFVPNRWDFINISENCVCLDNTVFSVFLSSVFFRQCLKKCHLLLIVRFGTGTRVHRLLELFSVSFGVSKSQLKVRFSGVEATPVAIDHSAWSEAVLIRFSVLAELMQCRGECTWKIRWNAVKKTFCLKVTPFLWFACYQLSKSCFTSPSYLPFIQPAKAGLEIWLWRFFQAHLNRINDPTTGSDWFWRGGKVRGKQIKPLPYTLLYFKRVYL